MGQDISRAEPVHHFLIGGRRFADMGHEGDARVFRHIERDVEGSDPLVAA